MQAGCKTMDLAFQMVAVVAVLGAMAGALWMLNRRRIPVGGATHLRLEGRVPLTANHSLHLVYFEGARLLVATHPGGCTVLQSQSGEGAGEVSK